MKLLPGLRPHAEAGADMIFPEGLVSVEEIEHVCKEVPVPVHYNRTGVSPMISKEKLEAYGVKMVSNATGGASNDCSCDLGLYA